MTVSDAPREGLAPPLIFGSLAVMATTGFLGVAFSPVLLVESPLALIALSPLFRHLVLVAPTVDALPFFVVAVVRLFLFDPFLYALGGRFGQRALGWIEARSVFMGKFVRWVEGMFTRVGSLVFLVNQGLTVCTMAGVFRMHKGLFVAVNLMGTVIQVALARYLGEVLRVWIERFLSWVDAHWLPLTAATFGMALVGWIFWRRQARERLAAIESPPPP